MKGDALASGAKSAVFVMGGDSKDAPIALRNVAPEEERLVSHVDNSAVLFQPKKKVPYYKAKRPLSDRILVKRLESRASNSPIIIPDSARGQSDVGVVIAVSPFSKSGLEAGALILFDKFAIVGQEIMLGDEYGELSEHLMVQDCDILMEIEIIVPDETK